jgi:hypothetical protein
MVRLCAPPGIAWSGRPAGAGWPFASRPEPIELGKPTSTSCGGGKPSTLQLGSVWHRTPRQSNGQNAKEPPAASAQRSVGREPAVPIIAAKSFATGNAVKLGNWGSTLAAAVKQLPSLW